MIHNTVQFLAINFMISKTYVKNISVKYIINFFRENVKPLINYKLVNWFQFNYL